MSGPGPSSGGGELAWELVVPPAAGAGDGEGDVLCGRLWSLGTAGIFESADGTVVAAFDDEDAAHRTRAELGRADAAVRPAPSTGWVEQWQRWSRPTVVGPVVIRAPWHADHPGAGSSVVIDPGASFGHGGHVTTRLALGHLTRAVSPGTSVLDVGCGSGVLAVIAAVLGASPVLALDVDAEAVAATAANARRNAVPVEVRLGTVDDRVGPFDVVVANLLAPVLQALGRRLVDATAHHGTLVVSGLVTEQRAAVEEALLPLRTEVVDVAGDWVALLLRRPADGMWEPSPG